MDKEIASGGEVEIERFPTRTLEARSKDLVPVFDYLQTTKYQKTRYTEVLWVFLSTDSYYDMSLAYKPYMPFVLFLFPSPCILAFDAN